MPRNLRKRGRIWWARIQKSGVTHERSLETDSRGVAQERLEAFRRELTASRFGEAPKRTFDAAVRRFSQEHYRTLKPKSRKRYAVSLINLTDIFQGVALVDIGPALLGDFERARAASGVTTSTIRRDLACLSSVFSRAEEWEWVTANPVKPYLRGRRNAGLKEGAARTRYLTFEEEMEILACAPPKASIAIVFAIDTGLRKEEQFSLLASDVDLDAAQVAVRAEVSKNGRARIVPLQARTLDLLKGMVRGIGNAPVFATGAGARYSPGSPTMYEALQKAVRRANKARVASGIEPMRPVSWHDLRRTCGCRLLQVHRLRMEEVSLWLGHGDVRITQQRYAFLKAEDLHGALRRSSDVVAFPKIKTERAKVGTRGRDSD